MNEKALKTLEYNKIIEMLENKALTGTGKEKCRLLKPSNRLEEIKLSQEETSQSASMILKKGAIPLGGMKDIRQSLKRTSIGGVLSIAELLHVGDFLHVCNKAVAYGKDDGKNDVYPMLQPLFEAIVTADRLQREISRCILSEFEVADDASAELLRIRKTIKTANDRVKEQLNSVLHSQTYKTMLQDSVITIRSGRFCVPVKQEYKSAFPGIIHDQSSTGVTAFMEPMSVVNLNNKIKELQAGEEKEIEKILTRLSIEVNEHSDILKTNMEVLTNLDFIFAKGQLSIAMRATEPLFNDAGYINIKKGRHPLLNQDTVVPTDIYLGKEFTTLLITGPNTGGKTVSLKTVGLFTLMGQAGLHIPAFDNSELSVFDQIFADIGDEQSIEQSLSTFSSHMTNIVSILSALTDNSLVLLDELGAGTDPTEGAALAIAIIQYLHDRQIRSAVTTHYSELKVYALSTEGEEYASCEFDVVSLRPTYRLLIGIPGKSNAFAISKRLGLEDHIIDAAKATISKESKRFEDVITDLEISKKTVILEQERAEAYRREAEGLKEDFEKEKLKFAQRKEKLLKEAQEQARQIMLQAKNQADALMKELNRQVKSGSRQESENTRKQIREKLSELGDGLGVSYGGEERKVPEHLRPGEKVFIRSFNQTATTLGEPDNNGDLMVQAGIMKIKVNIKDLYLDDSEEDIKVNNKNFSAAAKAGKSLHISPEIDLRGCLVEEGIERTDKYLDDAYLAGMKQVVIIHGKGTGALRSAIQNHLKKHPHVKNYRLGTFGEGEDGVTVAELR